MTAAFLLLLALPSPAAAGRTLLLRCGDGGFEARVTEGQGFAESALGLQRLPLWCPDLGRVAQGWIPGPGAAAAELSRLAGSAAAADEAVTVTPERALNTLGLTTIGRLRARLAMPDADGYLLDGVTCRPLKTYFGTTDFPLCHGSRLEVQVLPMTWD